MFKYIAIGLVSLLLFIAVAIISWGFGVNNTCVAKENEITAQWQQMENVLATNIVNELKASAFVTKDYSATYIAGLETTIKRYANDKTLLFKMVTEANNVAPDSKLWSAMQDAVSASYGKFAIEQKEKIDRARNYKTYVNQQPTKLMANFLGYPSEKVDKIMNTVISTDEAAEAFQTGKFKAVNPFK